MANIITNIVTTSKQAATAIDVIVVNADPKCESRPVASLLPPIMASSATEDSCSAPLAIRRFPAGDAFMHPPILFFVDDITAAQQQQEQ